MILSYGLFRTSRPRFCRIQGSILALAVAILFVLPNAAGADPAKVRDEVFGSGIDTITWNEAAWTLGGNPVGGCATFLGGTLTGPGNETDADSLFCDPTPDGWHWSVVLPGNRVIVWGVDGLPLDVLVCGEIFYSLQHAMLDVDIDFHADWISVSDGLLHEVIYEGPYSGFDPEGEGFLPTHVRRCGIITAVPVGACCFVDGHCEFLNEYDCIRLDGLPQGVGSVCEPNPCPQPEQACCLEDGSCQMLTAERCVALGGTPQGIGTLCESVECPQPPGTGACCIGDQGDCRILTEVECLDLGGEYQGDDEPCDPNPCEIVPERGITWGRIRSSYR